MTTCPGFLTCPILMYPFYHSQSADLSSTSKILTLIPKLCYSAENYTLLNSTVVLLAKRHGQLKEAVVKMMDTAAGFLPEIKEKKGVDTWLEFLKTLRGVTEGKVCSSRSSSNDIITQNHGRGGLAIIPEVDMQYRS